jgi:hypothetical protein
VATDRGSHFDHADPVGAGNHLVEASYPGDSNFAGSTSATVTLAGVTAPAVTVTPSLPGISTAQALNVTITVSGSPTPTGTVVLTGGGYTSAATALANGSATLAISAGSLAIGSDTLTASYTPDSSSSSTYNGAAGSSSAVTVTQATPSFNSMSPAFGSAGGSAFTLKLTGTGFVSGSTVYWGTTALATQFASSSQLTAQVTAAEISSAGITAVSVQSPTLGGGTSNALQFEVDSAGTGSGPAPIFTTSAASVTAGVPASYPVTVSSPVTNVSVTCLNLPTGATCSYSSATGAVTITTSSTTPKGTYQITVVFTETMAGSASAFVVLPLLLLPLLVMRRKLVGRNIWFAASLALVVLAGVATAVGCGGSSSVSLTSPTHQVTSSGGVTLTIQ